MRLFIALNIAERPKQLLNNKFKLIKEEIKQDLKWVKPSNWHLTLKFLGDTAEKDVDLIKSSLLNIEESFNQFPILFRGIGAFPNPGYPRVLFFNIVKGNKKITVIHKKLESELTDLGFSAEKNNYHPHLTIARSRKKNNLKQVAKTLKKFKTKKYFVNIHMHVKKISLMESHLLPSGPEYREITGIYLQ